MGSDSHMDARAIFKQVEEGDFIYILQGATKPTIVRVYNGYCTVVVTAVIPTWQKTTIPK